MGALHINESVRLVLLVIGAGVIIFAAFTYDSAVPKAIEESPQQLSGLQQKAAAVDATNEQNEVLEEWANQFKGFKDANDAFDSGITSWTMLAKDDYGKIGSASIFPPAYAALQQEGKSALAFIEESRERFIRAEVNPQALEDQIQNRLTESTTVLSQVVFELLLIQRQSAEEKALILSRGEPTNIVDNKINQLTKVIDELRAAQG